MTSENEKTEIYRGCGNVFADLGLEDSDQLYARAKLGFQVHKILEERGLKQREISALLGIPQPEVSRLMNNEYNRFSTDKLLSFLKKLDREIIVLVRPLNPDSHEGEATFAL
ncbi:MAG: helix-turn-helix domain-containing protein [Xenococcaceae cyanobacterium]